MTTINFYSKHYTILVTEHTNEVAEDLGYNIADEEFICDAVDKAGVEVRGYIMKSIYGMVRQKVGPVTLRRDELQEWVR